MTFGIASTLDLHILPFFGDYFIDSIEPADVRTWKEQQTDKPSTINGRLRVLRTLLADATNELGLPRNPAARVTALRDKRSEDDPNRLQTHELVRVLHEFETTEPDWYPLFLLRNVSTRLRQSRYEFYEVIALARIAAAAG